MIFKNGKKSRKILEEGGVNITPLMDVLTVLIFFLLQGLEIDSLTIATPKELQLPTSILANESLEEAIKISLGPTELRADDQLILTLHQGHFQRKDLEKDGRTVRELRKFLDQRTQNRKEFFKKVGNIADLPENKVIMLIDKDLPFKLTKYVLHTVTQSGYGDYQFVAVPRFAN